MNLFTEPHFQDAAAARKRIESIRWPNGPICPHCDESRRFYATKKEGRYRCGNPQCRKDFTVTTGTCMESSHIPLHMWLMAFYLLCSSKKGISSLQLQRALGIEWNSAWFLAMRIREAMRAGGLTAKLGGDGKVVEADETYHGRQQNPTPSAARKGRPYIKGSRPAPKRQIVSLVERAGSVRSFHVAATDKFEVGNIVRRNVATESRLHTDESPLYSPLARSSRRTRRSITPRRNTRVVRAMS